MLETSFVLVSVCCMHDAGSVSRVPAGKQTGRKPSEAILGTPATRDLAAWGSLANCFPPTRDPTLFSHLGGWMRGLVWSADSALLCALQIISAFISSKAYGSPFLVWCVGLGVTEALR